MSTARINFPLYTIINSPGEVMFCITSEGAAMTLFTSDENLKLFSKRSKDLQPVVTIAVIENKNDLAAILRKPSTKAKEINNFIVLMDPISPDVGEYLAFDRDGMLKSLASWD
jgi:hypothetical protein